MAFALLQESHLSPFVAKAEQRRAAARNNFIFIAAQQGTVERYQQLTRYRWIPRQSCTEQSPGCDPRCL